MFLLVAVKVNEKLSLHVRAKKKDRKLEFLDDPAVYIFRKNARFIILLSPITC